MRSKRVIASDNERQQLVDDEAMGRHHPADEQKAYRAAGFGRRSGLGKRPALLIIDVQYRTVGTEPDAVLGGHQGIPDLLRRGRLGGGAAHRRRCSRCSAPSGWPVLYPHVSPKESFDTGPPGRQGAGADDRRHATATTSSRRWRRGPNDILLPKKHPSAFFGTPLASYLIDLGADTLVVTGCTTSGCVRGSVVDGFAYNFQVLVPHDARLRPQRRSRTRSTCSTWRRNTPT